MRFRIFQYPLPAPSALEDLNAFLAGQRVASVSHHVVNTGGSALLIFVVETTGGGANQPGPSAETRVDYRERLTAEEFARFSRLREARKQWAELEGVPVYTVFTNAQLAQIVRTQARTAADLAGIEGLGAGRLEKYGARLLELLTSPAPPGGSP